MDTIFTLLARKGTFDTGQVDRMIEYGKSLVGTGRGSIDNINIKKYYCSSVGPFWSYCENMPDKQEITDQGVICIGLVSLCLRHVGLYAPFLFNRDFLDLEFGYGGTDEWLYTFQDSVEPFDVKGTYPRGTLLFRVYNVIDQGHVAILIEASGMATKNILDCKVLQSGGIPLSTGLVNCDETVRMQHEYYSRGTAWEWDKRSKFNLKFDNIGYYTHILRPEKYLPACSNFKKKKR